MIEHFFTNRKDIIIEWESKRRLPDNLSFAPDLRLFPSFNVEVLDENLNNIYTYSNIPSSEKIGKISKFSYEARQKLIMENPAIAWASPRVQSEIFIDNDIINNNFTFSIEENYRIFLEKNNKEGFYKNIYLKISHNDYAKNSYECFVQYKNINFEEFTSSIEKAYRSSDGLTLKLKLDPNKFILSEVKGLLLMNKANDLNLKPLYISDIESKWLDTISSSKILTLPFNETEILEQANVLDCEIYPLPASESWITEEILKTNNLHKIKNFINSFLNYKLNYSLYKINTETKAVEYQGYIYLFNPQSYEEISWPKETKNIKNINYLNYFVKNKNLQNLNSLCLNTPPQVEENIVNIEFDPNIDETLGYYNLDETDFFDVKKDLTYIKSLNINSIKILEVKEVENEYILYIEFITNIKNTEEIMPLNVSNLNFIQKYFKYINGENLTCLLFSIKFNKTNYIELNRIINEKIMVNFSFKYNNI